METLSYNDIDISTIYMHDPEGTEVSRCICLNDDDLSQLIMHQPLDQLGPQAGSQDLLQSYVAPPVFNLESLKNGHIMHRKCLIKWIKTQIRTEIRDRNSGRSLVIGEVRVKCPSCRQLIDSRSIDQLGGLSLYTKILSDEIESREQNQQQRERNRQQRAIANSIKNIKFEFFDMRITPLIAGIVSVRFELCNRDLVLNTTILATSIIGSVVLLSKILKKPLTKIRKSVDFFAHLLVGFYVGINNEHLHEISRPDVWGGPLVLAVKGYLDYRNEVLRLR